MIKFVFLSLIFVTTSYIGYAWGEGFKTRFYQLKELIKIITLLQNEVIYNNTPLPEALFILGKKSKEPFNQICIEVGDDLLSPKSRGIYEAFLYSYKDKKNMIYLNEEDTRIIEDFIRSLGDLGVYGQEKIFSLVLRNLEMSSKDAEEYYRKNTKMYRYLGVCFGAMITIFLL
ncbi:MAG: stage III sporulation protein SpoIIIAB [Clostridium sp.]